VVVLCQGAIARADVFSHYFRSAANLKDLSIQDYTDFAFHGAKAGRPLPTSVDTLDDADTYNNGFVYVNVYDSNACQGNIVSVSGRPTNICFKAYENTSSADPTGSYRYSCNEGGRYLLFNLVGLVIDCFRANVGVMYTEQFSDVGCTQSLPILQESMDCANFVGRTASFRGFCNENPSVLPLPNDEFYTQWSTTCLLIAALLY
jgi:hypothetical protein